MMTSSARPVTAEAFAPYGRLLFPGERLRMGAAGKIVLALDPREAGPRRVRHLQRYVDARRFLMSIGEGSLLLVVAGVGDKPVGPAAAFRIPPGVGVLLEAGVWHAGPVAIADATVLEGLEAGGLADRLDRRTVADAFGAEGLRIMMPDEVGAPGPGLDLSAEFSVTVDERLRDRLLLGASPSTGSRSPRPAPTSATRGTASSPSCAASGEARPPRATSPRSSPPAPSNAASGSTPPAPAPRARRSCAASCSGRRYSASTRSSTP